MNVGVQWMNLFRNNSQKRNFPTRYRTCSEVHRGKRPLNFSAIGRTLVRGFHLPTPLSFSLSFSRIRCLCAIYSLAEKTSVVNSFQPHSPEALQSELTALQFRCRPRALAAESTLIVRRRQVRDRNSRKSHALRSPISDEPLGPRR